MTADLSAADLVCVIFGMGVAPMDPAAERSKALREAWEQWADANPDLPLAEPTPEAVRALAAAWDARKAERDARKRELR